MENTQQELAGTGEADFAPQAKASRRVVSDIEHSEAPKPPPPDGFITEAELLRRLPVSRRTLGYWRRRKLIPYVKLPGCRRILYDWAGIRAALLRQQIGGVL